MEISLGLEVNLLAKSYKFAKDESSEKFKEYLETQEYEDILEKTLASLSDLEKEAHLKTLREFEESGVSEDELRKINLYVLLKKEDVQIDDNLNNKDKVLLEQYDSMFNKIYEAMQEKREERLDFKPMQSKFMMTDTILKTLDLKQGNTPTEHSINLEV